MYTATFMFRMRSQDADFDRFNTMIDEVARENEGFIRREGWLRDDGQVRAVIYYWDTLEALAEFSEHPVHREAKRRYREWYAGYEVVVSEVIRRSADGNL